MTDNSGQMPGHFSGAPSDAPSVRDSSLLDEDRDIVPIRDLIRVPPDLLCSGSDAFSLLIRLLWLQKLICWEPAVRFASDKIEHLVSEYPKPEGNRVAGLRLVPLGLQP